jgi:hypothetical protein
MMGDVSFQILTVKALIKNRDSFKQLAKKSNEGNAKLLFEPAIRGA